MKLCSWKTSHFEKSTTWGKYAETDYGHEFEQAPRVGDGQGSLGCCSPWGRKELDVTEWLNWSELHLFSFLKKITAVTKAVISYKVFACVCMKTAIANGFYNEPGDLNSAWSFFSDHSVSLKKSQFAFLDFSFSHMIDERNKVENFKNPSELLDLVVLWKWAEIRSIF